MYYNKKKNDGEVEDEEEQEEQVWLSGKHFMPVCLTHLVLVIQWYAFDIPIITVFKLEHKKLQSHTFQLYLSAFCLQTGDREFQKLTFEQMVWIPDNFAENAFNRITLYKETMLKPLEVSYPG